MAELYQSGSGEGSVQMAGDLLVSDYCRYYHVTGSRWRHNQQPDYCEHMQPHLRIARPVTDIGRSIAMYRKGLGLVEIGRFENHAGFDGVMLGNPGLSYHFEFTCCVIHAVSPAPTPEDLVVFYLPDPIEWQTRCSLMLEAGFAEVAPFNPYWQQRGRTFQDHDGYRTVLEQDAWTDAELSERPA